MEVSTNARFAKGKQCTYMLKASVSHSATHVQHVKCFVVGDCRLIPNLQLEYKYECMSSSAHESHMNRGSTLG